MSGGCTSRGVPSKATTERGMRLLDSRRLTGPNLLMQGAGAVVEVACDEAEAESLVAAWRRRAHEMASRMGWDPVELYARRFEGGASLALAAPIDVLYAACEVNEWALEAAGQDLAGADVDSETAAARLQALVAEEQNPALLALRDAADARGVAFLSDDDHASVGLGRGSQTWPVDALPNPAELDWASVHDIPVLLVTGTNGKSTTVRLVAAMVEAAGKTPGVSSTDWIRVGADQLDAGDYSGPGGARAILRDPRTDIAVLETARGGMFRRGLGVRRADAAAVLNVAADHLGEWGVGDLEGLAEGKFVVAKAIDTRGVLVLNADEPPVVARGRSLGLPTCWFGLDARQPDLAAHRAAGGNVCTLDSGTLVLTWDGETHALLDEVDLPISFGGKARFNTSNALAASALAAAAGLPVAAIRAGLRAFESSPEANPGRMNLFEIDGATVLADFAHNPHGFRALFQMARAFDARRTCVLLGQAGDRTDADVRGLCVETAAGHPDLILVKDMPEHLRGREPGAMVALIDAELRRAGVPASRIEHVPSELAAVERALAWAQPGDLLLLLLHAQRSRGLALLEGALS